MRAIAVCAGLVAAWAAVTWPQARHMPDMVGGHVDALFSVWRLAWIDAAWRDPRLDLWDAPIFFPATATLAYSDSVLMPAALGSVAGALGLAPVAAYNTVLTIYIVGAGLMMATLVKILTGRWLAGLVAGIIFTLNPHQAEHFERLEIQTGVWLPALFLCWHEAARRGSRAWGFAATLCLGAQWLSGMYFGLFLAVALPCLLVTWPWFTNTAERSRVVVGAAGGLVLSLALIAATATPYLEARTVVGERSVEETSRYSAVASDFISVPPRNVLYGGVLPHGAGERALFPGVLALGLAVLGLVVAPGRVRLLYLAVGLVAFDLTLGTNGIVLPLARDYLVPLRGIRAPARAATLLMVPLSIFAGFGAARVLAATTAPRWQAGAAIGMVICLVAEYRMTPLLWSVPRPDASLARDLTPASVVAEFPMPPAQRLDTSLDAHYMVERIGLWPRLVNGSSGAYPRHYVSLLQQVRNFPDDHAIGALRHIGVTHVTVHERFLLERYPGLLARVAQQPNLVRVGSYRRSEGEVTVYALVNPRPTS